MRILHTADWHFDKKLEGRDRLPEQVQFVEELCDICEREQVELVLMAGDVFQTPNPSSAAEELFYYAIDRLSANGARGVVIIAGNHDSPDRLCAATPLAARNGITLIGRPKDEISLTQMAQPNRVRRVNAGPSRVELQIPGCDHSAVIAALPYPSEARLKELLTQSTEDSEIRNAYNEQVAYIFQQLASHYRPDTVNLAMSHLYVNGGVMSDSEHQIQVGGAYSVDPSSFPGSAQYVALGHLHRPQTVSGAPSPARYAGSPLAYSFSECNHKKSVVLIDVNPGEPAQIQEIPLSSGKPLVKWEVKGGLAEVVHRIEAGQDLNAWIDLSVHIQTTLTMDEIQTLRRLHAGIVTIQPILPELDQILQPDELRGLSIDQLFIRYFERQTGGGTPDDELVNLFLQLTQQAGEELEAEFEDGEEMAG